MGVVEKKEKRMIRDIPTLHEFIVKQFIAKTPTKCMTQPAVQRFLKAAQDPNCFRGHADIVQEILDCIIISGRMTDDACPASIFVNRTFVNLSNSRISSKKFRCLFISEPGFVSNHFFLFFLIVGCYFHMQVNMFFDYWNFVLQRWCRWMYQVVFK